MTKEFTALLIAVALALPAAGPATARTPSTERAAAPPSEPPVLTEPLGSDQAATYRGTGNRALRGYLPGPLAVIQARSLLAGTDRFAIAITRTTIALVHGARTVRSLPLPDGTLTLSRISEAVDDPRWIAQVEPGVYLLRAALVHGRGTTLEIAGPDVRELRLADRPDVFLGGVNGGTARVADTRIVGWDERTDRVDVDYELSRPFIIYGHGARLDVVRSEIAYLGYDRGSAYGLSWREGGATGSVVDSDVHHMFFGMYSYEASDLELRDSRWHDCVYYGIDPHDFSTGVEIVGNEVYRNGTHGIIVSRGVNDAVIRGNRSHDNAGNGIVLDAGSDRGRVVDNDVDDNRGDGIVVLGSSQARIERNTITGNRVGVRVNLRSLDNVIEGNLVRRNRVGLQIYDGALGSVLRDNEVVGSGTTGMVLDGGSTMVDGGRITDTGVGVSVRGVAQLNGVEIGRVERGVEVRRTGILQGHDLRINASRVGVQLREGADAELHDSQISAHEAVTGDLRREAGNVRQLPFAWLTVAGLAFLGLAVVMQVLHRLRNRETAAVVVPGGVTNVR
jgi:parallel beta-helix repeat protein